MLPICILVICFIWAGCILSGVIYRVFTTKLLLCCVPCAWPNKFLNLLLRLPVHGNLFFCCPLSLFAVALFYDCFKQNRRVNIVKYAICFLIFFTACFSISLVFIMKYCNLCNCSVFCALILVFVCLEDCK